MKGHIRQVGSDRWQVMYDAGPDPVTGRRRQRSRTIRGDRGAAQALLADINAELDQGVWVDDGAILVRDLIEIFLAGRGARIRPTTKEWYRQKLSYLDELVGHRKAAKITGGTLTALYARLLERGLSGTTVYGVHRAARSMFSAGVKWGYLRADPTLRADVPRKDTREMSTWTAAELGRFFDATVADRWHVAWVLCAMTGLRRGELAGLEWPDLDLDRGKLTVRRSVAVAAGKVVEGKPKTASSYRTIDLDYSTVELLKAYRERGGVRRIGRVFTWEDGSHIHPDILTKAFHRAVVASGLPEIRLHDLRHGWASLALEAGVHLRVVADRLGHRSPVMTLATYSHAHREADREAADAVAALVQRARNKARNIGP